MNLTCTFYRPEAVNHREFSNIVSKLGWDLHQLETGKHDEWDVYCYVYALLRHAKPTTQDASMTFLSVHPPRQMPHDARVEFVYLPTYLAAAFIMKAVLLYPSLMDEVTFLDSELDFTPAAVRTGLAALLLGCTGRSFDGAGIFSTEECLQLFRDAGAAEFLRTYPDLCSAFANLFAEAGRCCHMD